METRKYVFESLWKQFITESSDPDIENMMLGLGFEQQVEKMLGAESRWKKQLSLPYDAARDDYRPAPIVLTITADIYSDTIELSSEAGPGAEPDPQSGVLPGAEEKTIQRGTEQGTPNEQIEQEIRQYLVQANLGQRW
jgi:hypothetical protein